MMRANFAAKFRTGRARDARKGMMSGNLVFRTGGIPDTWGFLLRSTLVFGWKSRAASKADAIRSGSKVSRPSCPRPPHCHPERSRGALCWESNREVPASGWAPQATAGLSTAGRDSQANPFPPLKMTREINHIKRLLSTAHSTQRILRRFQQGFRADRLAGRMFHP
jgi:hypothetical protein